MDVRKVTSGQVSHAGGDDFSVISPNKSNYSGNTYPGIRKPFQAHVNPDNYDQNNQYFPSVVEDLLSGKEEWRNIQDIIKMTMKAMCEVIRDQGRAINDLEQAMYTKANKSDLNSALETKANIADVGKAITEVASAVEEKASLEEVNVLMEDKISKQDLQYLLTNKVSIQELRTLLEAKCNTQEVNQKMQYMDNKLEQTIRDLQSKTRGFALQSDLSHVVVQLELKADINEVNESLSAKANKATVANALHRKANKGDIEEELKDKISKKDLTDLFEEFQKETQDLCTALINKEKSRLVKMDHFKEVENIVLRKADKAEIDMYLSAVNTQKKDFDRRMQNIESETSEVLKTVQNNLESMRTSWVETLNRKVDWQDFEKVQNDVENKLGQETVLNMLNKAKSDLYISVNEIREEFIQDRKKYEDGVYERASRAEVNSERSLEEIRKIKDKLESLEASRRTIEEDTVSYTKSMYESSRKEMLHEIGRLETQLSILRSDITSQSKSFISHDEFDSFKKENTEEVKEKVSVDEVQRAITGCQNDTINRIAACKDSILDALQEVNETINDKLESKAELEELENKYNFITDREANAVNSISKRLDLIDSKLKEVYTITEQKVHQDEFLGERDKLGMFIETIENELSSKMNISDARLLLDQKCNIDDVNKALTEVHQELDTKANYSTAQDEINKALCAENCVGRWIWKSGDLRNGFAVPWEVETINTCPENFLWEQDNTNIMTVAPGLYEIMFGFFSKKKPTIQLLVNGEPCLSAVNSSSYVIHHSSGKLKSTAKHKEGNIAGLTLIDFVALPARARVSISYSGDSSAEGFFGMRKL